jgi:hypothetical protein
MKLTPLLVCAGVFFGMATPTMAGPIVEQAKEVEKLIDGGKGVDAVLAMDNAVAKLWDRLPLTFLEALFVAGRPSGYGIYDQRPDNRFKAGEDMLVYAELAGYEYKRDGNLFVIYIAADVEVKSADGKVLGGKKEFAKFGLRSRVPNREFYAVLTYNFTGLKPGNYVAVTTMTDKASGDVSSFDLPFVIGQ